MLDEVAALSPATQSKLLRVLEERAFERLGGTETLTIEARLIALTNADLARAVAAGRFREDLYFRLSVLTIRVPALRERPADIVPLAEHLLARLAAVHGRPDASFSEAARKALRGLRLARQCSRTQERHRARAGFHEQAGARARGFPGEHSHGRVRARPADCVRWKRSSAKPSQATLEATRYKITRAAEILGISRKTLLDKRKKYGLQLSAGAGTMRIRLLLLGKTRRPEIRALLDDYAGRIRRFADLEIRRGTRGFAGGVAAPGMPPRAPPWFCSTPQGKQFDSAQFAAWLGRCRDRGVRELVFLVRRGRRLSRGAGPPRNHAHLRFRR